MDFKSIEVNIPSKTVNYSIIIGQGLMENAGSLIKDVYRGRKIMVVTDENVDGLYGDIMLKSLEKEGFVVIKYIIPPGEKSKSNYYLHKGYDIMVENGFGRDHLVVAFGGGVVGDLAGYLAATYMRGIGLVQIPTTLLSQVDSSVGGKTAINHPAGKNLIGAFYQPDRVIIDVGVLKSLEKRELRAGMAEVIKYGLIFDSDFVDYLRNNYQEVFVYNPRVLGRIIEQSCNYKARIVEEDQKEKGIRALLNFGHTIGHSLEAVTGYRKYKHGEAVAIGMVGAARLSERLELLQEGEADKVAEILRLYGLPLSYQYGEDPEMVYKTLFYDKKVKDNKLTWILLKNIGKGFIKNDVNDNIINEVLEGLK